jgi:hypothetical protein
MLTSLILTLHPEVRRFAAEAVAMLRPFKCWGGASGLMTLWWSYIPARRSGRSEP